MLTILPVGLLLFAALAVYFLRFIRRGTGYAWLTAILAALIVWGGILALHWFPPEPLNVSPWRPFDPGAANPIRLAWDNISWPYGFALLSTVLAVLLTASARLELNSNPITWAANLVIAAAGITAVLAATPLTVLLAWVVLDILDLILILRLSKTWRYTSRGVMAFIVRTVSSFLLIGALVLQRSHGDALAFDAMNPTATVLFLISVGLRLGLLPLNTPYAGDFPFQRGVISFIRLSSYAAGLAAMGRLSQINLPGFWQPFLFFVTVVACLYGAGMWLFAKDEIHGRPYWLLSMAGLAFISVLRGNSAASVAWGVVMLTSGIAIFLYSARTRGLTAFLMVGALSLTGLPFTPAVAGWGGLFSAPIQPGNILTLVVVALMVAGYGRHALADGPKFSELDSWVRGVYPAGFAIVILSAWLSAIFGISGWTGLNHWVPAGISVVIAVGLSFLIQRFHLRQAIVPESQNRIWAALRRIGRGLASFLSLTWLYEFLWYVYRGLRRVVGFFTVIFEGDGGLLWAFVLLTLLFTIISTRGGAR